MSYAAKDLISWSRRAQIARKRAVRTGSLRSFATARHCEAKARLTAIYIFSGEYI
jgi:hypothetical protein